MAKIILLTVVCLMFCFQCSESNNEAAQTSYKNPTLQELDGKKSRKCFLVAAIKAMAVIY